MKFRTHLLTLLAATLCAPALARAESLPAGDAARGYKAFVEIGCAGCHGTVGQGGPGLRLAPNPKSAQAIATYIRNPTGVMPPFTSAELSDATIIDIHAYLETVKPPPKLADIKLLN